MSHSEHEHEDEDEHEEEHEHEEEMVEPTEEELFGPVVPSEVLELRAGPISLQFDPDWAFLRRLMIGGREVLRAVYPAVRSSKWKTAPPRVSDLVVEKGEESFQLAFQCEHVDAETGVDFAWRGEIIGRSDGTVSYEFDGAARAEMRTNRTGLCVLHPILGVAGRDVVVTHGDGREETAVFPVLISPHQVFFEVAALTQQIGDGLGGKVTFEGDEFETEDQRNWTDASFKTYGGALSKPLPLTLAAGQRVRQKVTFSLANGKVPATQSADSEPVRVSLPASGTVVMPSLGTRWAPEAGYADGGSVDCWRRLAPGHLMIDVDLTAAGWQERMESGRLWAAGVGARVLLRVIFTPNHQPSLALMVRAFATDPQALLAVIVVNPGEPCPGEVTLGLVAGAFRRALPWVPVAAAPADNFADMNRFRPSPAYWAAPPMCPQVHTFDHQSLMENIEAQPALLATARSFNPHPLLVGPVALLRRRVPDPRQGSLFAAAWTAGSLAAVLPSGLVAAATYHEHDGQRGVPGTPCDAVLEGLAGAVSTAPTQVSDPAAVAALTVFEANGARRVLLANLTRATVEIALDGDDEALFEFGPYASAWVDA
jgi:hypothetical protein